MSYTHFVSTAKCEVDSNFNLEEYITSLCDFVTNHLDDLHGGIRVELEELTEDGFNLLAKRYIRELGSNILIECDTENNNYNSEIWYWLCDQVRQDVMIGKMMEINTVTIDSRCGVETSNGFYTKSGRWIGADDILKIAEESGIFDEIN